MDPLSALSLAASILTFVDYARQIITGTSEIYHSASGITKDNAYIEDVIKDLKQITTDLDADFIGQTKHEKALISLGEKCHNLSQELLDLIGSLSYAGERTAWKSLKTKIKSMRKEKEVTSMEKRLGEYRSEILSRLTFTLYHQQSSIKRQLDELTQSGSTRSNESAAQLAKLRADILQAVEELKNEEIRPGTVLMEKGILGIRASLEKMSCMISSVPRENIILANLYFASMTTRASEICAAETGTFEWILQEGEEDLRSSSSLDTSDENEEDLLGSSSPGVSDAEGEDQERNKASVLRDRTRASFLEWLRNGKGVFHISGKPGSGKSTLMSFLSGHKRTMEELQLWAGEDRELVFARFFFWKSANDDKQMSLDGLYRSILFEVLKRIPELIPALFPAQWTELGYNTIYVEGALLNAETIKDAFTILTQTDRFPRYRFCFFIDGLDEYSGDHVAHVALARSLQTWTSSDDLKICASSRPYIEFDIISPDSSDQKIHLHQLTKADIQHYTRQQIEKDERFEQLKDDYLRLVDKVVEMSQGVFLWARLVICELLHAMHRRDRMEVLMKKLEVMPREIDTLYTQMLSSLAADDQDRAYKMLLLTAHNPFDHPLRIIFYAWIDDLDDIEFPPIDGKKPAAWPTMEELISNVRLQLMSLTKGLLETSNMEIDVVGPFVRFSHRTVRDFILNRFDSKFETSRWPTLIQTETYYRLLLAGVTILSKQQRVLYWNNLLTGEQTFLGELPVTILSAFHRIFEDAYDSEEENPNHKHCHGWIQSYNSTAYTHKLSFLHRAAYAGQQEYVMQEIAAGQSLYNDLGQLHVLLSAAAGYQKSLVTALIQNGASPLDIVNVALWWGTNGDSPKTQELPLWLVYTTYVVCTFFRGMYVSDKDAIYNRAETLELLLQDKTLNTGDCFFLLGKGPKPPATHYMTL